MENLKERISQLEIRHRKSRITNLLLSFGIFLIGIDSLWFHVLGVLESRDAGTLIAIIGAAFIGSIQATWRGSEELKLLLYISSEEAAPKEYAS